MKLKYFTLCAFMLAMSVNLFSQSHRDCGAMENLEFRKSNDDKIDHTMKAIEAQTKAFVNNPQRVVDGIITIPTVVHVIYNNNNENISDAQIFSQMDVLNLDFRLLNLDADNTWPQNADSEIEFCLASVDPNGNSTTGITRTSSSTSSWGTNDAMKFSSNGGVDAWPAGDYLNIWVCNIGGGILGYAQFPGGAASTDGVVVGPNYFGSTGYLSPPFDEGRTTTHEVGHWLNLRHIWGDGGCNVDDFVSDTPVSDASNGGCAVGHVSCGTTDMVQNYMDYSDDACMNLFTEGQKTRMRALFDTGGFRASLLNSGGCGTAGPGATCNDGIQNQGETGVDCGGPCAACPSGCSDNEVVITITFDNYPEETSWSLTNASGATVASGGTYASQADGSTLSITECLVDGCYDFTINDTYGDGICCSYGSGSYTVASGGSTLASGGSFTSSETTNFCFGGTAPTCNDGIQNQGETGVDCGGPCTACATCNDGIQNQGETDVDCGGPCAACPTCNDGVQNGGETGVDCGGPCAPCGGGGDCQTVNIDFENFESGWGIWNDGGSDCARVNYSPYASSGNYTARIRDNTNSSVATTDNLNLTGFEEVQIDFTYYPSGMENNEDFWLQGSLDGGSTWTTVGIWARPDDFQNGSFYSESIVITGDYTSTTKWRFRCDASANNDRIYLDDINITGCVNANREVDPGEIVGEILELDSNIEDTELSISEMNVFPNPTRDILNINYQLSADSEVEMFVYDVNGKVITREVFNSEKGNQRHQVDATEFDAGFYFISLKAGDEVVTKRFIAIK